MMAADTAPAAVPGPPEQPGDQATTATPQRGFLASALAAVEPARPTAFNLDPDSSDSPQHPAAGAMDGVLDQSAPGVSSDTFRGTTDTTSKDRDPAGGRHTKSVWKEWALAAATRWAKGGGTANKRLDLAKARAQAGAHQVKENRTSTVMNSGGLLGRGNGGSGIGSKGSGGAGGKSGGGSSKDSARKGPVNPSSSRPGPGPRSNSGSGSGSGGGGRGGSGGGRGPVGNTGTGHPGGHKQDRPTKSPASKNSKTPGGPGPAGAPGSRGPAGPSGTGSAGSGSSGGSGKGGTHPGSNPGQSKPSHGKSGQDQPDQSKGGQSKADTGKGGTSKNDAASKPSPAGKDGKSTAGKDGAAGKDGISLTKDGNGTAQKHGKPGKDKHTGQLGVARGPHSPALQKSRETGHKDGSTVRNIVDHVVAYTAGYRDGYSDQKQDNAKEHARLDQAHTDYKNTPTAPQPPTEQPKEPQQRQKEADDMAVQPLSVKAIDADSLTVLAGGTERTITRGELRTFKQYERKLDEKHTLLVKVADAAKGLQGRAEKAYRQCEQLAEDAKGVADGTKLVQTTLRLAEAAKVQAEQAAELTRRAQRAAEMCKAVLANIGTRYAPLYKAVVDSDETKPAELRFYSDRGTVHTPAA